MTELENKTNGSEREHGHDHGMMKFKGFRGGSTSFHGVEKSVLVSALQKCIRSKQVKEAQWAAMELVLFDQVADNKAKAILTNLSNRLEIISCEDVSETSWPILLYVDNQLSKWTGNTEVGQPSNDERIMRCCIAMAHPRTAMLRFASLARSAWWTIVKYHQYDAETFRKQLTLPSWTQILSTKPAHKSVLDHALELVQADEIHDQIYYWAYELVQHMDEPAWQLDDKRAVGLVQVQSIVPNKKKKPEVWVLWNKLLEMANVKNSTLWKVIRVLFKWFQKKRVEQFLFLFKAIRLTQVADKINWSLSLYEQLLIDVESTEQLQREAHKRAPAMVLPQKAYDMHTMGGKTDYERFAKEGAAVENKDTTFDVAEYEKVYLMIKQVQDKMGKYRVKQLQEAIQAGKPLQEAVQAGKSIVDQQSEMKQEGAKKPTLATKKPTSATEKPTSARAKKRKAGDAAEAATVFERTWFRQHIEEKKEWIDAHMAAHVDEYIHAQRITSNWKQHVLLTDSWIYKGPFDVSQPNVVTRLHRMSERWNIFQAIGFKMPRYFFLRSQADPTHVWIQFEAMHSIPSNKWSFIERRDTDTYRVVERSSTGVTTGVDVTE
jgi:hypothetical protein